MNKIAILSLSLAFSAINFSYSQTKIAKLTFETDPTDTDPAITDISYTTSIPEFSDHELFSGTGDRRPEYFYRTINNMPDVTFNTINDLGDYFFAAHNVTNGNTNTETLTLEEIDVNGYENLELRVYLASKTDSSSPNRGWDNNIGGNDDYIHFNYDLDNSSVFSSCLWLEGEGVVPNEDNQIVRIDTDFDGTGDGSPINQTFTQFTAPITGTGSTLDIVIEFRINNDDEDIAIDNIEIWGTLINSTCTGTPATWNGSNWTGSTPDISTPAVINGTYSTIANGSFSACSLTVNGNLTINDDGYVEVEHDVTVTVTGFLTVENHGNFVQNNDSASFTNSGGTSTVRKSTQILNNWYDYTFWSSPVSGLTIGTGPLRDSNKRYWYNANNYLDENTETNNTGSFTSGYDHIDDNGDDWQFANSGKAMEPGMGFAATHSQIGFNPGTSYGYHFVGEFNNGVITPTLPIYYNPANSGGHWNLVGNPYPCALDFDAFITNNPGIIEGVALLWSQATDISETASGSQKYNFSQNDFIIMTSGSGSVNNSPGTLLEYIPSGQSFFIKGIGNGNVTFNNSMRIKNGPSNNQFFKRSNIKSKSNSQANKLWLNLTSDLGYFNQILVAYVDGATNDYDGMAYDAPRNLSSGGASILYTQINTENNGTKYAIQGKDIESLNKDEVIPLGFATLIESQTSYSLSIDHLQGDFLTKNPVYLKDNLLNKLHNLSESNYTFTSNVGEFNSRFEIVFNNTNSLSTDNKELANNSLQLFYLDNHQVNFKSLNDLTIKQITIYDLNGRKLYDHKGGNNSETYSLANLNNAVYIAKIKLSNGAIVSKKIIKD